MAPSVCALWLVCALLSVAASAVANERISCNPCAETSGCCGLQCCSDAVHDQVSVDDKERTDVGATARPTATMATHEQLAPPSVTPMANWTTVFRVGEKGFGCMRFPELHFANNTLYMFVECCECKHTHCMQTTHASSQTSSVLCCTCMRACTSINCMDPLQRRLHCDAAPAFHPARVAVHFCACRGHWPVLARNCTS
jgi:hypothetical protein